MLKIIQNLLELGIPKELFDDTVETLNQNKKLVDQEFQFLKCGSAFVKYFISEVYRIRHAMFSETSVASTGAYEVSQEIARLLQQILKQSETCYKDWSKQLKEAITLACLNIEKLSETERDVLFSIILGADFFRVSAGCCVSTETKQLMSVLGYKTKSQETNWDNKKGIQLSPTFVDKDSVLVGMYFNNSNKEQ